MKNMRSLTLPPLVPLPFDCVIRSAKEEFRRFSTSAIMAGSGWCSG